MAVLGRLKIQEGTRVVLGDRVRVRGRVTINGGGLVTVGADTLLNGCWIGGRTSVTIGAGCLISDCDITDSDFHNLEPSRRHEPPGERTQRPVHLGENVWVGAHAIVLKGSTIGRNSVVGAGAVVRGEVPSDVVVRRQPSQSGQAPRYRRTSGVTRTMLVASPGGHLDELQILIDLLGIDASDALWVTGKTSQTESLLEGKEVAWLPRVGSGEMRKAAFGLPAAIRLHRRFRPELLVSTGALFSTPHLVAASMFGCETWFIDSATRVDGPSHTGVFARRFTRAKLFAQGTGLGRRTLGARAERLRCLRGRAQGDAVHR